MKFVYASVLLLALLFGMGMLLFGGDTALTNFPPPNATIVAFGDSLVSGEGATKGNDFVSVLGRSIGREIVNKGIPGNTTADGLARVSDIARLKPGIVLLLLGGNDTLRQIPVETTEANLRGIITTLQKGGSLIVLIGVRGGILSDKKADLYESLAEEYGLVYVSDILDGILLHPELMHDGIHPNDAGYRIIADRIQRVLTENKLLN